MLPESLLAPRLPGAAQGELITVRQSFLSDDGGTRNTSSLTVNVSSVSASSMMYVRWTAAGLTTLSCMCVPVAPTPTVYELWRGVTAYQLGSGLASPLLR